MLVGSTLVLFSVLFSLWENFPIYLSLTVFYLGLSFALVPGISIIPYLLPYRMWGRGFGIILMGNSVGQLVAITTISLTKDSAFNYATYLASGSLFIAVIAITFVNLFDYKNGRMINRKQQFWRDIMWNNTLVSTSTQ